LPLLDGDPFFLLNADTLSTVDLGGLLAAHRASGALVTLAVVPNPAPERYGGVLVDGEGRVEGFTRAGDPRLAYHFVGVQVAAHAVFTSLADGVPAESVSGVYRTLMAERPGTVRAWVTASSFHDIGTPRDCLDTSLALAGGDTAALRGAGSTVSPSAHLEDTVVWDAVRVGPDCRLEACILGDGVDLLAGFQASHAVVVPAAACPPDTPGRRVDGMIVVPL
jgi:mannose-1-phosphate guanylyltransferase